jgi:hypothetical protein
MIGSTKVEPQSFEFEIMTGKQLRKKLVGLHDSDTVLALLIRFKQEGNRSQEVVYIGIERQTGEP